MDAMELLLTRDSAVRLTEPGPDAAALEKIFKSALRAPDHGRLRPWRFIVIAGAGRERYGEKMAALLKAREPDATPDMLAREKQKALRAPVLVVAAAHYQKSDKIPQAEQLISAGAAAQNIMLAAHGLGFGAMWRTGAPAYDANVKELLGLDAADAIVGFIYIGTRVGGPAPGERPEPADFVTNWRG